MTEDTTLLDVVEGLYAMALDDESWSASLDSMAELFGAAGVSFEVIETASNRPVFLQLGPDIKREIAQEYLDYYAGVSPRVRYNKGKPSGFISYDHMILSEAEMDRDEFYADCLRPGGLRYFLAAQVRCSESHQAVFAVQRSPAQGHVGDRDITLFKSLVPHLQQAMDLQFRLAAARAKSRLDLESLGRLNEGCLIIDRTGHALHVNPKGAEIVSHGDGVALRDGSLFFADKSATRRYGRVLGQLCAADRDPTDMTGDNFPACRPSGKRPYLVSLRALPQQTELADLAWPAAAIVFIRDPDRFSRIDTRLLQQSYGLSATETALAAALDRGLTLRDVANDRQVSITTVRSQLYALMGKMDVRRQTDLIRLLAHYRRPFT